MRIVMALVLVAVTSATPSCASEKRPEAEGAGEKELGGAWDGDAGRADDWGEVNLTSIEHGYIGTYSATFNGQLGSVTFQRVGERRYNGLWWESSLKRYGSCALEASKDGRTITMTWKALDDRTGAEKSGKSTWKRKGE